MSATVRTVQINVIGDSTSAQGAIKKVAEESESAGGRINKTFSNMLGMLNRNDLLGPFGSALEGISQSFDVLNEKAKSLGSKMMGLGGVGLGVGGALTAIAGPEQASSQQLQTAIGDAGQAYADYREEIEKTAKANENLGISSKDTNDALATLVTGTHDTGKALDSMGLAADLAAKQHISLNDAALEVVKVIEGKGTKVLAQFGITTQSAETATKALTAAQKAAVTADDSVATSKQKLADFETILSGKKRVTAADLIRERDLQDNVVKAVDKAKTAHDNLAKAQDAVKTASEGATSQMGQLAQAVSGQAQAKIDTFMGRLDVMKTKIEDSAAQFGQKYGPALMAASAAITIVGGALEAGAAAWAAFDAGAMITMGTIGIVVVAVAALGIAAYELYKHWDTIWSGIKSVASSAWDFLKRGWNDLANMFSAGVSAIGRIGGNIARALVDPILGAINMVISGWDSLHFSFPGVHIPIPGVPDIPGFSFGLPGIPHIPMLAQGGIVTAPTLAVIGEAGPEAVVPLSRGGIAPAAGGYGTMTTTINLDGRPIAQATYQHVRNKMLQAGRSMPNLGLS